MKYNAIYGQSGGPTSVINASLYGVIKECEKQENIDTLFLMHNGIKGLIDNNIKDIKEVSKRQISLLKQTPSAILGSIRYKLKPFEEDETDYLKIVENIKKNNIKYIFLNGGNDSMDTTKKLSDYFKKINLECKVVGIPKTIDNDLMHTHFTPGYPSSAKFIANCIKDIYYDNDCYPKGRINIVEIMGRDTGWLTASSALVKEYKPDLIYVPEVPFDIEQFLLDVQEIYSKKKRCLVAVSEGIKDINNNFICTQGKNDAFAHHQLGGVGFYLSSLINERLNISTRAIELSLLQRSFSQLCSKVDIECAIKAGRYAVKFALEGLSNIMVIINYEKNNFTYSYHQLDTIANQIKYLDRTMINDKGNNVTNEFIKYGNKLINGENKLIYKNGICVFANKNKF